MVGFHRGSTPLMNAGPRAAGMPCNEKAWCMSKRELDEPPGGNRNNWKTEVWEGARLRQGGAAVGKKNRGERVLVKKDYRTVC